MNRQRVLVLGAGGYIGTRVVAALGASDWAVPLAAFHRNSGAWPDGTEALRLDARDQAAVERALGGVAAVVNCVAGDGEAIIAGARSLFGALAKVHPRVRAVHMSTMLVYGTTTGDVDETMPLRGDWDDYGAAKVEAEKLARECANVVTLRPGIVYGPGSPIWSEQVARWLRARQLGDLGAAGRGYCNLVHVDDVVAAILSGLRAPGIEGEAFNLSLSHTPTWNEYFAAYAQALGTPVRAVSGPRLAWETKVLALPLKFAQLAAQASRSSWRPPAPVRPWLLRLCGHPMRLDVRKAQRVLGMNWTPLDIGLRAVAADFLARSAAR
jgi:nucleoside-diphosphate-sugar epimerase